MKPFGSLKEHQFYVKQKYIQHLHELHNSALQPDLHKRQYFINKYNKQHTTFCRRSNHERWFRGQCTGRSIHITKHKNFGMEIPPEKSETMSFLGQGPVRCKIVVDNKHLYQLQFCKHLDWEIYYENEKKSIRTNKISSNTGNYKQQFGQEIFTNALALPIFLYVSEIWTLRKKKVKMIDMNQDEIFQQNSRLHPFWLHKDWRSVGRVERITSSPETQKMQIRLATT